MQRTPLFRFLVLLAAAVAMQLLPMLAFPADGDGSLLLYFVYLYAAFPIASALIPYWAGLGGVHPLAAFLPIGGMLLLFPVYHSPGVALLCIVISLIASVAGQEVRKRRAEKGGHHGGNAHQAGKPGYTRKSGKKTKK